MSNCVDCSGEDREHRVGVTGNVNPLDCNNQFMQCGNPCRSGPKNTPQCETLPSQIQNFTDQFFGTVVKTEVNGKVVWSLPCSLEVGLPNNPRAQGEGLACYFLRMFRDGIGGLVGPQGAPGTPGLHGSNTYTVTLQPFAQPTIASPLTQIVIVPNPSILEDLGVFIEGSGVYEVMNVAPGGVVFLTLVSSVSNPVAVVPAGSLVVPVGFPRAGLGPVGPQGTPGAPGASGPQGVAGSSVTSSDNGMWSAYDSNGALISGLIGFTIPAPATTVTFVTAVPGFTPVGAGRYLVNVAVNLWLPVSSTGFVNLWLLNTHSGSVYPNTQQEVFAQPSSSFTTVSMTAIVTISGAAGESVRLMASSTDAGTYIISPVGTQITWVRVA